jgi:hypothetical protein
MKRQSWACVLALALTGCSDDDEGMTSPARGLVGGQSFALASALVDYSRSDSDEFAIDLYASKVACDASGSSLNRVLLTVPRTPGDHTIGDGITTATFVVSDGQRRISEGHVQIAEVTSTRVRGGVNLYFDARNRLDGQFEATVCK